MADSLTLFLLALKSALICALVALPWGLCWGWILARTSFKGKSFLEGLIYLPAFLPAGLFIFLADLGRFSPISGEMIFFQTFAALNLLVSSPFLVYFVKKSLKSIDPQYEKIGRSLGASSVKVFFSIVFPLIRSAVLTGFLMTLVRSLAEWCAFLFFWGQWAGLFGLRELYLFTLVIYLAVCLCFINKKETPYLV